MSLHKEFGEIKESKTDRERKILLSIVVLFAFTTINKCAHTVHKHYGSTSAAAAVFLNRKSFWILGTIMRCKQYGTYPRSQQYYSVCVFYFNRSHREKIIF